MGLIVCGTCKEHLPHDSFAKCKSNARTGRQWSCRSCKAEQAKKYHGRYDIKFRDWKHNIKKKYGITPDDWDRMYEQQGGKCAICSCDCTTGRKLAVDHCHTSGNVRGLLCAKCNQGLGYFDDNTDFLGKAIEYLNQPKDKE